MNVIFLDFDGVLNSDRYILTHRAQGIALDPLCMTLLADIVNAGRAKIVLTTSWRSHWSANPKRCDITGEEINAKFAEYGLEIYDKTPHIGYVREEEILAWLDDNPEVTNFVVLDDMFLEHRYLEGHFVRTSSLRGGLDEDDTKEAISILNGSF
ncbi:MAG: hypothetical protein IJ021_06755 [Clostridia bacterium]|nr:hypothetical protein [Clostridia bacterium]